jgi:hypothetical protein
MAVEDASPVTITTADIASGERWEGGWRELGKRTENWEMQIEPYLRLLFILFCLLQGPSTLQELGKQSKRNHPRPHFLDKTPLFWGYGKLIHLIVPPLSPAKALSVS